jgi:hypothetical protein
MKTSQMHPQNHPSTQYPHLLVSILTLSRIYIALLVARYTLHPLLTRIMSLPELTWPQAVFLYFAAPLIVFAWNMSRPTHPCWKIRYNQDVQRTEIQLALKEAASVIGQAVAVTGQLQDLLKQTQQILTSASSTAAPPQTNPTSSTPTTP